MIVTLALLAYLHFGGHRSVPQNNLTMVKLGGDGGKSLGEGLWGFNLAPTEQDLERIMPMMDTDAALTLNSDTLNTLEVVYADLVNQSEQIDWPRVAILIDKSFPTGSDQGLAQLLQRYFQYREYLAQEAQSQSARAEDLKAQMMVQEQFFGRRTARQLFSKKNLQTAYFADRQRIRSEQNISASELESKLRALEERFKNDLLVTQ